MTKIRVHEYAKKVNKPSKDIIDELSKMNIKVNNHMATLEDTAVTKLDGIYKKTAQGNRAQGSQSRPQGQNQRRGQSGQGSQGGQNRSQGGQSRPQGGQGQNRTGGQGGQNRSQST